MTLQQKEEWLKDVNHIISHGLYAQGSLTKFVNIRHKLEQQIKQEKMRLSFIPALTAWMKGQLQVMSTAKHLQLCTEI